MENLRDKLNQLSSRDLCKERFQLPRHPKK